MNKIVIIIASAIILGSAFAAYWMLGGEAKIRNIITTVSETADIKKGGRLFITNGDIGNLTIIPNDGSQIEADTTGPREDAKKLRFFKVGDDAEIRLSDSWNKLKTIVRVPKDIIIDVSLTKKSNLNITDPLGDYLITDTDKFQIRSDSLTELSISNTGVSAEGTGNALGTGDNTQDPGISDWNSLISEDGTGWLTLQDTPRNSDDPSEIPGAEDEDEEGTEDEYQQPNNDEEEYQEDEAPEANPCAALPNDPAKDICCGEENLKTPTDCEGTWVFDTIIQDCKHICFDNRREDHSEPEQDTTSLLCSERTTQAERDICCRDFLENPIKIGPREGFPDCIGSWFFDNTTEKCTFRCANYGEMIEIMKEIED